MAPVVPGAVDDLKALLATMGDGVANGSVLDFGALSDVHFARLIVVDEDDSSGEPLPASLVLLSDFDVSVETHLDELVDTAGDGIDRLFGHCEGYPTGEPTRDDRLAYLTSHRVKEAARYVNTTGRTARQIRQEAELRDAIEDSLDRDPSQRRGSGRSAPVGPGAFGSGAGRWPGRASRRSGPGSPRACATWGTWLRFRSSCCRCSRWSLLAAPFFALLLWKHERGDHPPHEKPGEELVQELARLEDHVVQNPFTALGHVKPSRFRRWTLIVILFFLNYATRHFFNRGNLSGVKTIHFARWVFIDDRRRMFFASNYDGSLESYMDDFIDKVAWGLNLVFSTASATRRRGGSCSAAPRTSLPSRTTCACIRCRPGSGIPPTAG